MLFGIGIFQRFPAFPGVQLVAVQGRHGGLRGQGSDHGSGPGVGYVGNRLAAHGHISRAYGIAGKNGDLGRSGFGVSVNQLGSAAEQRALMAGHGYSQAVGVHQGDHGQAEAVAQPHKPGRLPGVLGGDAAVIDLVVVGHQAHGASADAAQRGVDGGAVALVQLDYLIAVGQVGHQRGGLFGIVAHGQAVQILAVGQRRVFHVGSGQQVDQGGDEGEGFVFVFGGQRHSALGVHGFRAEQLLSGLGPALFAVHHLGGVQPDLAGFLHFNIDVAQLGHHGGQARAGAHNAGDDRAYAGEPRHGAENLGVSGQGVHALLQLDARAVQQRHDGRAGHPGHVQGFEHFCRLGGGHRAAAGGEVLGEAIHRLAVHRAAAGHGVAVLAQGVDFHEAARVKELGGAFPRGALAVGVLLGHALGVARQDRRLFHGQSLQSFRHFQSFFPHSPVILVMKVLK